MVADCLIRVAQRKSLWFGEGIYVSSRVSDEQDRNMQDLTDQGILDRQNVIEENDTVWIVVCSAFEWKI